MANNRKKSKKQTPLQRKFKTQQKRLDKILAELGKEERVKSNVKLTTKYVESLQKITKKELTDYYTNTLSKRRTAVISTRLTNATNTNTNTDRNKVDVILSGNNIIDAQTGEILVDNFDEESFSEIHPDHYEQWLESRYPNYNFVNLQELKDSYINYIEIAKERLHAFLDLPYKGAQILRNNINLYISKYGENVFYEVIARMDNVFWESIDIAAHYGDDEINTSGAEFRLNCDLIMHLISVAISQFW